VRAHMQWWPELDVFLNVQDGNRPAACARSAIDVRCSIWYDMRTIAYEGFASADGSAGNARIRGYQRIHSINPLFVEGRYHDHWS
jgi:hypothetical protein